VVRRGSPVRWDFDRKRGGACAHFGVAGTTNASAQASPRAKQAVTIPEAFQLAVQRHQAGRLAEAEALYRQILGGHPNHAGALHHLGVIAQQAGRHALAVDLICQSLAFESNNPVAHSNLGEAYRTLGLLDKAVAAYRRALELKPDYAAAHSNLAIALKALGQLDEAIAEYRRALELKPDFPEAHNNLGVAYKARGNLEEAVAEYRHALELNPGYPEAHCNLGVALRERGQLDDAIAALRRALELKPGFPEAYNHLGGALSDRGRHDEAIAAYGCALEFKPEYAEAHYNMGNALKEQGEFEEAMAEFRHALELRPDFVTAGSNLVYSLHFLPGFHDRTIADERPRWNRQFGEPLKPLIRPHANDRTVDRRLRVGYVSPDFRDHVVGRNLIPLFERHDGRNFEILCYSGVARPDGLTDEFRRRAHQWRSTVGVRDEELADRIRRDGVDILVDLTQHMAGNRLPMFAHKPAPVQVSFAGYPESTGLEAIKYRISDRYLEARSADEESRSKERLHLIESFWCYDPGGVEALPNPLPALETGRVTFGSLGNFRKVNGRTLKLWARALGSVKESRLLMWCPAGSHRQRTLEALEREGVESRRVEFVEFRPRREYLELYHRLDIVLDTFPYNGHTTNLDALWMGAPVVSLAGETPVSRAGLSQLTNLGLPEWVARSEMDYVNIAKSLADDLPRLAILRATLRERMETSVLMDAARFTLQVEQSYRDMWRAWCAGQSPICD